MVWKQGDFILGAILVCWKWGPYADPDQQGDTKEWQLHTLPSSVPLILESYYFCDGLFQRAPPIFPPNHLGFSFVGPPAKKINILSILPPSVGLLWMKKSKEGGEEIN